MHFSNPSPLFRFAPDPDNHWKLLGAGELMFKRDSVVLRGLRRRPDRSTVTQSAEIPLADVFNVNQRGRVVRFEVRVPLSTEKALQLWAADEDSAQRVVALLNSR